MSAWGMMPRAARRKAIEFALKDPRNVPAVRRQLQKLRDDREKTAQLLTAMDETIEDTEALVGGLRA
jgi:hypothetical protein